MKERAKTPRPRRVHKIQRVELYCLMHPLHCPFCGRAVYDPYNSTDWLQPCVHTLFCADDNSLFYRTPRYDALMRMEGVKSRDIDFGAGYTNELTDKLCCPDSVKYAIYTTPKRDFGIYFGFAPEEEA